MSNKIKNITYVLVLISLIVVILITAKSILIPAAWALIFAFIGMPIAHVLEKRKVSRITSSIVATITTMIIVGFVFFFLFYEATHILKDQDDVYEKLNSQMSLLLERIEAGTGFQVKNQFDTAVSSENIVKSLAHEIVALGKNLVAFVLIPMYIFFILNYRGLIQKFVKAKYHGESHEQAIMFLERSRQSIANYLKGTLLLTGISTLMSYIILLLFGIKYAFFFGLFIAVLNLIPYIGNLIAMIVIILFSFLTKDSSMIALFVAASLYISNAIQENFLRPKFLGDKMEMNAAIIFTSALAGGLIWGVSGLILFIPLTGIVKAFIDSNPSWNAYGVFFDSK